MKERESQLRTRQRKRFMSRREVMAALGGGVMLLPLVGSGDSSPDNNATPGRPNGSSDPNAHGAGLPAGESRAPVWKTLPTLAFTQGIAASISIAEFVSDPDGDSLSIVKNDVPLPAGVTYDPAGKRFVYDGRGPAAATDGHVLTARDGRT